MMLTIILAKSPAINALMLTAMLTVLAIGVVIWRVWWLLGRFDCLACGVAYSYAKSESCHPALYCSTACEPVGEDDGA